MEISGKAYFVSDPRRIEDLTVLHLVEKERPFEVVKIVKLAKIDYENFITDMVADRQFIEDHAALCSKGEVWRCILVQQCGHTDGVLVMPEDYCYVGWAAYSMWCCTEKKNAFDGPTEGEAENQLRKWTSEYL